MAVKAGLGLELTQLQFLRRGQRRRPHLQRPQQPRRQEEAEPVLGAIDALGGDLRAGKEVGR